MIAKAKAVLRRHLAIAIVSLAALCLQVPAAWNVKAYILTGQDVNPVHLGVLHLCNDMPPGDDSEVGEMAPRLLFTSAYYWIPYFMNRLLGIPLESMSLVHALLCVPLLLLGVYALGHSLFRSAVPALLGVLVISLSSFLFFSLNIGYHFLAFKSYYYGDFTHLFALASLVFMARGRYFASSVSSAILLLFNLSYGVNVIVVLGACMALGKGVKLFDRDTFACGAAILAGAVCAYLMVMAALVDQAPAPFDARRFAIQAYGHITPHIFDMGAYLWTQAAFIGVLGGSCAVHCGGGRAFKLSWMPRRTAFLTAMPLCLVLWGQLVYFGTYLFAPEMMVALAPSKLYMTCAFVCAACLGEALFRLFRKNLILAVATALLGIYLIFGNPSITVVRVSQLAVFVAALDLAVSFGFWRRAVPYGLQRAFGWRLLPAGGRRIAVSTLLTVASIIVVIELWKATAWIADGAYFKSPKAFLDIQERISAVAPKDAIFAPWRMAGVKTNRYGLFTSWPFRTYSRRGGITWVVGRNAYFNSMRRHNIEENVYAVSGLPLWEDLLPRAENLSNGSPLDFYFGIGVKDGSVCIGQSGIWALYMEKVMSFTSKVGGMGLPEYGEWAGKAGATHLLISHDPGQGLPDSLPGRVVLSNGCFTAVELVK